MYQDQEEPIFWFTRNVKCARKDYTCAHCHKPIPKGTRYHREFFKFAGDSKPQSFVAHDQYAYCTEIWPDDSDDQES